MGQRGVGWGRRHFVWGCGKEGRGTRGTESPPCVTRAQGGSCGEYYGGVDSQRVAVGRTGQLTGLQSNRGYRKLKG